MRLHHVADESRDCGTVTLRLKHAPIVTCLTLRLESRTKDESGYRSIFKSRRRRTKPSFVGYPRRSSWPGRMPTRGHGKRWRQDRVHQRITNNARSLRGYQAADIDISRRDHSHRQSSSSLGDGGRYNGGGMFLLHSRISNASFSRHTTVEAKTSSWYSARFSAYKLSDPERLVEHERAKSIDEQAELKANISSTPSSRCCRSL